MTIKLFLLVLGPTFVAMDVKQVIIFNIISAKNLSFDIKPNEFPYLLKSEFIC